MTTLERDKKYLIQCYTTDDVVFSKGKGIYMYDENGKKYLDYAEKILESLSIDAYLAKVGVNHGFILMHSVGSLPSCSEMYTPLNYADYYYLEAVKRFMYLKKLRLVNGEVKVIK